LLLDKQMLVSTQNRETNRSYYRLILLN